MTWQILVDWNKDNLYSHAYSNITSYVIGNLSWFLGCRFGSAIADETTLNITVNNDSRLFSKEYQDADAGRPLYNKILPGGIPIRVKYNSNTILTAFLNDIKPTTKRYDANTAVLECRGFKQYLDLVPAYPQLQENVTIDQIMTYIALSTANPPSVTRRWFLGTPGYSELGSTTILGALTDLALLDTGQAVIPYSGDNTQFDTNEKDRRNIYDLLKDALIAESGRSFIFMNRDGKYVFWNRYKFFNDDTPDLTLTNSFEDAEYTTVQDAIFNEVQVTFYPRVLAGADEIVWQLESSITIRVGTSETIFAHFNNEGRAIGAKDVVTPVLGADFAFSVGDASIAITPKGQGAEITLTNNGTDTAICTTLILRAKPLKSNNRVTITERDTTLINRYNKRVKKIDAKLVTTAEWAKQVAQFELIELSKERARINRVKLKNNANSFTYGIGSCVRVIDDQTGHDRNYIIIGERWTIDARNDSYITEWELTPVLSRYWRLGTSGASELGTTTRLSPI